MKVIRVGLVGSQFVSTIHLEALRSVPGAEVVAVASATEAHARGFAERHGIPRCFTDYRSMYDMPELDLVVLGLPNDLHCEATVAAAQAGKHVVCEKPLARTSALARDIVTAAGNAKTYFIPAMCMRFWPEWAWINEPINDATLRTRQDRQIPPPRRTTGVGRVLP